MTYNFEQKSEVANGRIEKWQQADAMLLQIFGLDELPEQCMSAKEQKEFSERIAAGDQTAKQEYILRRLRLAMIAAMYEEETQPESSSLTLEDYFQNIIEALQRRLEEYAKRCNSDIDFTEYVGWFAQNAQREHNNTASLIRVPIHVHEKWNKIDKFTLKHRQENDRDPSLEEIAAGVGLSQKQIERLQQGRWRRDHGMISLDIVQETLADTEASPFSKASNKITEEQLLSAVDKLPHRQKRVLQLRLGLGEEGPMTLEETGARFGVSREKARWVETQALDELRKMESIQALASHTSL